MRLASAPAILSLALLCPTCAEAPPARAPSDEPVGVLRNRSAAPILPAETRLATSDVTAMRDGEPCYAERHDPACGAPTHWKTTTCHWKNDCRMKEFGPAESLPDFVSSTTWHARGPAASACAEYFARSEGAWSKGDPENFGRVSIGYTHEETSEAWVPDDPTAYYGAGTQSCKVVYRGVVRYRAFSEYNVSLGGTLDDVEDNPCPSNDAAPFACFDRNAPTDWPACRRAEFGLDPNASACGPASPPPPIAWHAADADERSGLYANAPAEYATRRYPSIN